MITVYKTEKTYGPEELVELRGLSRDDKPTELNGKPIENGSQFIEIDTGKIYVYDLENEQWREI